MKFRKAKCIDFLNLRHKQPGHYQHKHTYSHTFPHSFPGFCHEVKEFKKVMLTKISLHHLFSVLWTQTGYCQQSWACSKEMLQISFIFYFWWSGMGKTLCSPEIKLDLFWIQWVLWWVDGGNYLKGPQKGPWAAMHLLPCYSYLRCGLALLPDGN